MKTNIYDESLLLSEEILANIELSQISLSNITLKVSRLARLLNELEFQKIFQYEASGYPTTPNGINPDIFSLLKKANRTYSQKNDKKELKEYAHYKSIEQYENEIEVFKLSLSVSTDPNVAISSSNPNQYVNHFGNTLERRTLREKISENSKILASRKSFLYNYALEKNYELKYSKVNKDIFTRIQFSVDSRMIDLLPETIKKFTSAYDNLVSENDEDWSNAVHSCRRILQDLADKIYPPRVDITKNGKTIKLGTENYINRLICYIEDHADSERFQEIVGSHLQYIGERLDSLFSAVQKGSHNIIKTQDEADRYVIYTYLIVGDILKLKDTVEQQQNQTSDVIDTI